MARSTKLFTEKKIYYNKDNGWKLRYKEVDNEGRYHFNILQHNDLVNDWAEYSTKDGSEITEKLETINEDRTILQPAIG